METLPLPSGQVENLLTTMGAGIRNEMSSQYTVRGGNFDENLIYINAIEIYRPMLMKSGQQEGLSFINPSLVSSISFSAGGFEASYGDRMSSVLDVTYRKPVEKAGSVEAGLLGASAHLEGISGNKRFTHLTGIRYKTSQYLLNTLPVKGDYRPSFFDLQSFLTYDVSDKLEISMLGNVAYNRYQVVPQSRSTSFGTLQQAMNFTVYYEGQEEDVFQTWLTALALRYQPTEHQVIRLTGSVIHSMESITYDIYGRYWIDLLDQTAGSDASRDSILNLGYGGSLDHARNYLDATIGNLKLSGSWSLSNSLLTWGLSFHTESIGDRIREWEMMDSAGYSIPVSQNDFGLYSLTSAKNQISWNRYDGFMQDSYRLNNRFGTTYFNMGIRFHYQDVTGQFILSPRLRIVHDPLWKRRFTFFAAAGAYDQPPGYKEMRDREGMLHPEVRTQRSVHWIVGSDYALSLWDRPFRLSAELYYKRFNLLIPYLLEDVQIQYLPQYTARGFAAGLELKINGEFVPGADSWASLSIMRTREDRQGDDRDSYPRPTDQLLNFGLYFQDYLPNNPSYRVHLNLYYGSRIPYGSPDQDYPDRELSLKAYRRVDIGLSKSLVTDRNGQRNERMAGLEDLRFSIEIFNLFDFENQASYQWIRTVSNQEGTPNLFAVPNYLTGRLLNFRLAAMF